MEIAEIQIASWDKIYLSKADGIEVKIGDYVIVEINSSKEIAKVVGIKNLSEEEIKIAYQQEEIGIIITKATFHDLEKLANYEKNKDKAIADCKKLIKKHQLAMKLIDVHFAFDDSKIVFAFIAEGRVDFRQLVKDLTRHFQKNIRLQQLGVRDEAKIAGDIGSCGIVQCCKTHLKELGNVSSEQAELQQVSHRGAERLSGICNRLKCCLRYENQLYKELAEKFPALGSLVKTPQGKGQIVEWHVLKQTVNVRLENDAETLIEVPVDKIS